jgi:hypothetical protein
MLATSVAGRLMDAEDAISVASQSGRYNLRSVSLYINIGNSSGNYMIN